jgi:hypothetical protein
MPAQGIGDNQRVGDRINTSGINLKKIFGQKGDRPNVNWRYIVLSTPPGGSLLYANFEF